MFGFLFGTLCLIGLIKVARHGRGWGGGCHGRGYGGYGGYGGGWGDHRGGHHGWHESSDSEGSWRARARGYGGGRFFLRAMFQRLDTTPGQEKVITQAFEDMREKGRAAKTELKAARVEVAKAMRSTSFDEVAVGTATAQVEAVMDSMRKAAIDAFAKVHEALDDRQRGMFADFIENGPRFRDFRGGWGHGGGRGGDYGNHPNEGGPYRYSV